MKENIGILDFLFVAVILFGPAVYCSLQAGTPESGEDAEVCEFSARENIAAAVSQTVQLVAAMLYLHLRGIHPLSVQVHLSIQAILAAVALFLIAGVCMDLVTSIQYGVRWITESIRQNTPFLSAAEEITPSLVMISLLNGFYEEFFFLAVWSMVEPRYSALAFCVTIAIRILIHTYQGWTTALAMGVGLGGSYGILFTRVSGNLFIYIAAHILADLFGLSFVHLL